MPCRVGITTNPEERKVHWRSRVVGFENWRIIGRHQSKQRAQDHEDQYARQWGCVAHAGGPDAPGTWHVYAFDYTRMK